MCSTSATKVGSFLASSYARSSSSRAGISVSGTYRPPKAPKRSVAGGAAVRSCAGIYGISEGAHARVVFDPGRRLHTGGDVHHVGPQQSNRVYHIFRTQAAGEYHSGAPPLP